MVDGAVLGDTFGITSLGAISENELKLGLRLGNDCGGTWMGVGRLAVGGCGRDFDLDGGSRGDVRSLDMEALVTKPVAERLIASFRRGVA